MITGALKDVRFYAGIAVAFAIMYAMQYYRAKKTSS